MHRYYFDHNHNYFTQKSTHSHLPGGGVWGFEGVWKVIPVLQTLNDLGSRLDSMLLKRYEKMQKVHTGNLKLYTSALFTMRMN